MQGGNEVTIRRVFVVALVAMAMCGAMATSASAAPTAPAPTSPALVPVRCPLCVVVAVTAVRAAVVVRTATAARAVVTSAAALRAASKGFIRTTRARVGTVSREARTVARRGSRWTKRNWPKLRYDTRNCLSAAAFLQAKDFLVDGKLSYLEFRSWVTFGGGWLQYPPGSEWSIRFPLRVDSSELAGKSGEIAFSCALGMGVAKYWRTKSGPRPK